MYVLILVNWDKKIFNKNISLLFKLGQDYQIFQGDITDKNYTNTMLKKINKDFEVPSMEYTNLRLKLIIY